MKFRNHLLTLTAICLYGLLFYGSGPAKQAAVVPQPIRVPSYDYAPPPAEKAKSAQVVFLMVNPVYQEKFQYSSYQLFNDFSKAMAGDFNEALTAKGFSVRGPFEYYDNVVYNDKKESDLMLQVEIDFNINSSNVNWTGAPVYVSGRGKTTVYRTEYTYDGYFVLSGKINLVVSEPLTKEKLWAKSIPLQQKQINIAPIYRATRQLDYSTAFTRDAGVMNPMIDVLEDYYKQIFNTAWMHLDPNELSPLKKEVLEIREKKKYLP
jgi:hypothetical protein